MLRGLGRSAPAPGRGAVVLQGAVCGGTCWRRAALGRRDESWRALCVLLFGVVDWGFDGTFGARLGGALGPRRLCWLKDGGGLFECVRA